MNREAGSPIVTRSMQAPGIAEDGLVNEKLTPESRISRTSSIFGPFLILLFVLQCAWLIRTQAFTNDEPEHLVAGLEAWRYGEFKHWHDQPPLARLLFAIPLLSTDWKYQLIDDQVHPVTPAPEVWLYRARPVNVALGIVLLLLLWFTARRLFSEPAANFVLALAVLSPDLIAHFSLATIDGIGCLMIFASVVQLMRYRRRPSWSRTVVLGVLLGLLLLAKFNSPPLVLLALAFVLITGGGSMSFSVRKLQWKRGAVVLMTACIVLWAGYFFHVSRVIFANQMATIHFAGYTKLLKYDMPTLQTPITVYWPACEWFTGLGQVVVHNMEGHRSFLLGHYSTSGFRSYFPVAMLVKWPLIILLLGVAGAVLILLCKLPSRRELLLMSVFPAVYFAFAITAHIDIGVRHVLPLYPFLLLYAGVVWEWAESRRWLKIILVVLVVAQGVDIARYAPNDLSYFNVAVNPAKTWMLLSDSNTDWGQGLIALRQYQSDHPNEIIHLAYGGEVDPAWYGIRYTRLKENDHPTGTVIVSATHLSGELLTNHYAYRWLLQYPVKTILDYTFYVFDVPEER